GAVGLRPVLALRRVPALRVLRSDLDPTEASAWLVFTSGLSGLAALLWWKAGSATLGTAMLAGIGATLAVLGLLAWGLILLVRRLRGRLRGAWRYGLANVGRRAGASIAQVSALGLGLMALLLLSFVRTDLLERWRQSLPADAPNRFIVNVQQDQVDPLRAFVSERGLPEPVLFPMIRARLVERTASRPAAPTIRRTAAPAAWPNASSTSAAPKPCAPTTRWWPDASGQGGRNSPSCRWSRSWPAIWAGRSATRSPSTSPAPASPPASPACARWTGRASSPTSSCWPRRVRWTVSPAATSPR